MPADLNDFFKKRKDEEEGSNMPEFMKDFGKKATYIYVIIVLVILLIIAKPYEIINSGEVGIKVTAGKYDPIPLEPGIHFYIPGIQKIIKVDTKVRIINYKAEKEAPSFGALREGIIEKPAIEVLDARGLPVSIDITVQYKLNPQGAPQTIATWGLTWEEKIINAVVREVVRNVVGRYKAEELPIKRNEIAKLIESQIREKISSLPNKPVTLVAVQLREISLPPKIKEQIERVQIAKQEAERVKYEVERARQEAEKRAALARGEAEAKKIKAQGEADRIMIEAKAQAQANIVIGKSITPELLQLKQIEVQGKFNEALKANKDAKIFLTPGGAVPNIWVDTKDKQKATSVGR
ncbi:prohibitin family protein [Nitrosophilus kaiyonis]|uniref:prohibitin family protein n=1 Tax=Nitrosophilus kaiyonis TaxID=2930200 RepID=UPI0024906E5D|nr:prohibitin family protein [Nitrosophilus kaiyonis]